MKFSFFISIVICLFFGTTMLSFGENGVLVIQVSDLQNKPLKGIVISVKGDGGIGNPTDETGKTRIKLGEFVKPSTRVTLLLVSSPNNNLVMISPWDGEVVIPSFDNAAINFVPVYLSEIGNKTLLLQNEKALASIANNIIDGIQKSQKKQFDIIANKIDNARFEDIKKIILEETAKRYGLLPEDIDKAIKAWGETSKDAYNKGLAAYYEKNYPESTKQWKEAYKKRKNDFFDVVYNLANSLNEEGEYKQAAEKYEEAAVIKPDNNELLFYMSCAYHSDANYVKALQIRKTIKEKIEASPSSATRLSAYLYFCNITFIGRSFERLNQIDSAILYYRKSLTMVSHLSEALKDQDTTIKNLYQSLIIYTYVDLESCCRAHDLQKEAFERRALISTVETIYGKNDTILANFYDQCASAFLSRDGKNDSEIAAKYEKYAIEIQSKNLPVNYQNLISSYFRIFIMEKITKGHQAEAEKALFIAKYIGENHLDSNNYFLGAVYTYLGSYYNDEKIDSSIYFFQKAANISLVNKDSGLYKFNLKNFLLTMGEKSFNIKQFKEAIHYYDSAYFIKKEITSLQQIGSCYYYLKNYSTAIKYYKKALGFDSTHELLYINSNLGMAYAANRNLNEAYTYFKAFENQHIDTGIVCRNWAMYYSINKDKVKAIAFLEKAINHGYKNIEWTTTDDSLEFIREDYNYKKLLKMMKEKTNSQAVSESIK